MLFLILQESSSEWASRIGGYLLIILQISSLFKSYMVGDFTLHTWEDASITSLQSYINILDPYKRQKETLRTSPCAN